MCVLRKDLIRIGLDCSSREEVMLLMADLFLERGLVRPSFSQALLDREQAYPTGLPAEAFDIAIPHTLAGHVITPAIGVALLNQGVDWQQMGSPEITLKPRLVFMLAIRDAKEQIEHLKKIMGIIQNTALLRDLALAADADEAARLLEPALA